MKRDELKGVLTKLNEKLEKLQNNDEIFVYATANKFLPKVGYINEIPSFEGLIEAQKRVLKVSSPENNTEAIEMLGLTEKEVPKVLTTEILGIPVKYWNSDIQTRLKELRHENLIAALEEKISVLENYLSEDELFEIDSDGVDDLLNS